MFKRYILKSNELNKRNILVVNKDNDDNILMLSDLLYKLSTLTNSDDIFENKLNIMCYSDEKNLYKKMLIENPKINFINTRFISGRSDVKESSKKQIVVVDFDYLNDIEYIKRFFDNDIYLIVTSTNYTSDIGKLMSVMREYKSTLFINKKDSLKLLQKRLFKKVICENLDEPIDVNLYIDFINDTDNVKTIMIKSGELRYF